MALSTLQRGTEPDGARGVDAVDDLVDPAFLRLGTRFDVGGRAAMKASGNDLLRRGIGQQISGDLLQRELIERHVGIERVHHPVAPGPDFAQIIALEAMRVRIAGEIEPRACPADAELLGGQETVHQLFQ